MDSNTQSSPESDGFFRSALAFGGYSGYAAIILFIIGGVWLGGMLPPLLNASDSPAQAVAKVSDNLLAIQIGSIFLIASFALFGSFGAGMAMQVRRYETTPGWSYIQLIFTAAGTTLALIVAFAWALMVFRPETYHPSIVLMWADLAYFIALFSVPVFGGWCVMVALSIFFAEEGNEPFPRWAGYLNLWMVLLFAPGQMIMFFKEGPFAWHGVIAMYLPFIAFFIWIGVMSHLMIKIAKEESE
jgi:hypothetical protein